ncbi:CUE domain protein [Emericellopsis atlantica]|uniref:CUE domain protein n=1 Tax=Emericellopsis atlantica TaxID=2614577 RepID=A0A9P7ZQA4_9HYPO|nr:CUE domain protein [Emericellopsis atlantica]KAG9256328.1 CUE domain protein [Emericellopsis atlantica]
MWRNVIADVAAPAPNPSLSVSYENKAYPKGRESSYPEANTIVLSVFGSLIYCRSRPGLLIMAGPTETPNKRQSYSGGAESPTTVRPFEMDDDDVQDSGVLSPDGNTTSISAATATNTAANTSTVATPPAPTVTDEEEPAPAKPPRPMTEAQKNQQTLKEAFPSIDMGVIKAVLSASGGRVEPAFNALLEMTDPDAVTREPPEEAAAAPPPQPPRPQGGRQISQLEADELYARQLADHFDNVGAYENRTSSRSRQQRQERGSEEDKEYSFIEDDLPQIRDNLRQGFFETQTKVNSWITTMKKRLEEQFDESDDQPQRPGHRTGESSRRSGDYDADPQVLSDDFAGMRFTQDGSKQCQDRASTRQGANMAAPANRSQSNIYRPPSHSPRPTSKSPRPNDGRRVGFKEETEEISMYDTSPKVPPKDNPPVKASKWQPLSTVEPSPIGDNDPFSLGDSEDEKDAKDTAKDKTKDKNDEDNERLKKAAAEAMADDLVAPGREGGSSKK